MIKFNLFRLKMQAAIVVLLLSNTVIHADQKPYSSQYPVFEPSGPDFKAEYEEGNSVTIRRAGLQGSVASIDHRYAKNRLPNLKSTTNHWSSVAWRGERLYAQLVIFSNEDLQHIRFESTPLISEDGTGLGADSLKAQFIRYVLAEGVLYPDILDPIETLDLPANTTRPVWVTIDVPHDAKAGQYSGKIVIVAAGGIQCDFVFQLEVLPLVLPNAKDWKFYLDLWQNPFAVARWHNVKLWSDEHFHLMEPYWRMLAQAGQKCLTVSLIHHPWRAQVYDGYKEMITWIHKSDGSWEYNFDLLDKYVAFAERVGLDDQINCYSMIPGSNRFRYIDQKTGDIREIEAKPGQSAYEEHWKPFLKALEKHILHKGWTGRLAIAMDEKPEEDILIAQGLIRKYAPSVKIASATNHPTKSFQLDDWSSSIGIPIAPKVIRKRNENPELVTTFYVCCGPQKPNTFTHSPPVESAWIGLYAAGRNLTGFLRWAYNSWNENPFYDTKYWTKKWPSGDCFLIYPGPRSSIRFERLREGIQDYEKIQILRKIAARKNDNPKVIQAIKDLDKALSMIDFKNAQKTASVTKQVNDVKDTILKLSRILTQ